MTPPLSSLTAQLLGAPQVDRVNVGSLPVAFAVLGVCAALGLGTGQLAAGLTSGRGWRFAFLAWGVLGLSLATAQVGTVYRHTAPRGQAPVMLDSASSLQVSPHVIEAGRVHTRSVKTCCLSLVTLRSPCSSVDNRWDGVGAVVPARGHEAGGGGRLNGALPPRVSGAHECLFK